MSEEKLVTKIRRISPSANVIDIHGEINAHSEQILKDAFSQATQNNIRTVIFNFTELAYLNSIGIGMLIMLVIRAQRQGVKIAGCGLSEHYQKIFQLTRLDQVIHIYESEEIALAYLEPFDLPEREY